MKNKFNIKGVIFDFDGTLVDTEKFYMRFWIQTAKDFGFKMTKSQYFKIRSLSRKYLIKQLKEWYGNNIDFDAMNSNMFKYRDKYFAKHIPTIKKGIRQAIKWLKENNIKVALATSGPQQVVSKQLKQLKLNNEFDEIVFTNPSLRGKPHPDIYLYTCKVLGLKPQQTAAIEDNPNGVMSAYKAKVNTILIPDLDKPNDKLLKLKIKVVKDGFELIKYLRSVK